VKKYGFRKLSNGWRFKIGGTSGEAFEVSLRYFSDDFIRLRFTVNINRDFLIRILGFNQKNIEFFRTGTGI